MANLLITKQELVQLMKEFKTESIEMEEEIYYMSIDSIGNRAVAITVVFHNEKPKKDRIILIAPGSGMIWMDLLEQKRKEEMLEENQKSNDAKRDLFNPENEL